jgi:hypothetical protein
MSQLHHPRNMALFFSNVPISKLAPTKLEVLMEKKHLKSALQ